MELDGSYDIAMELYTEYLYRSLSGASGAYSVIQKPEESSPVSYNLRLRLNVTANKVCVYLYADVLRELSLFILLVVHPCFPLSLSFPLANFSPLAYFLLTDFPLPRAVLPQFRLGNGDAIFFQKF